MTFDRPEYYELTAAVAYGTLFALGERWRPAHDVRRAADWRRDALGLVILVLGMWMVRRGVGGLVEASGLDAWLRTQPWRRWPKPVQIIASGVLVDFCLYWVHRLMHTRAFWNAHKWHHSVEHMYWLAGLRTSFVHAFLFVAPQVLVGVYFFDFSLTEVGQGAATGVFIQFFIHSNVRVPLGPLEYVFVTPQHHRRHHALVEGIAHGNYATAYAFWDRLFGAYVDYRKLPRNYPLGIGERGDTARMIIGI
jgi:sterol desaturase/sphingolipid hydroxylase (fatty acid hydroxylase superfamily)